MKAHNDHTDFLIQASADELRAEVAELREDNADLRASALRWQALYEAAVAAGEHDIPISTGRQGRRPAPGVNPSFLLPARGVPDGKLHSRTVYGANFELRK
jgi:hypothetical protein